MSQIHSLLNNPKVKISVFIVEPTENGFGLFVEYTIQFSTARKGCEEDDVRAAGGKDQAENVRIAKYSYGSLSDLEKVISLLVGKLKEQSLLS